MQLISVTIQKPEAINLSLGQTHFIKTVEAPMRRWATVLRVAPEPCCE